MRNATPRPPLRVALIGLGAIGRVLAETIGSGRHPGLALVGALCRRPTTDRVYDAPVCSRYADLLALEPELVVEAAGHAAVAAYGAEALRRGCDFLPASVGALADPDLLAELETAARAGGSQLLLPAGGLAGLDYLQAARLAGLDRVCLRSRKPPQAWRGTPAQAQIDLDSVAEPTVFFRGSARQAARDYPKNANVAAGLALATLGLDHTQVELVADPSLQGNVHEIEASGAAGELRLRLDNAASPDNPKTSLVTPYSLLHCMLGRCGGRA